MLFLQVFPGNTNAKDMLKINLDQPVLALFVRFVPKEWHSWPCMRVEVYGKPASKSTSQFLPLFENEPSCKTFLMKISLICMKINL